MKHGFTLVEMLAIIVILVIVGLIVAPITINTIEKEQQRIYQKQLDEIELIATLYVTDKSSTINDLKVIGESLTITLEDLSKAGYIDLPIKNQLTKDYFKEDCFTIKITLQSDSTYKYELDPNGAC